MCLNLMSNCSPGLPVPALPSPPEREHPAGEVPLTPVAGGDIAPEGYEPTEVGSDDEEAAIVDLRFCRKGA